ncbi:hypothetical protein EDC94DRAFT_275174 [Helicostylum pulchrum]|nr:hypothetical protein EDC94DRAFT_275174 [Helicostylum pulchrum]
MKIITVIVIAALITAITFRSMYGFFLPLGNSQLNLYNATSFFICLTTIVWSVFWFFKKEEPLIDTVPIVLDERNYRERRRPTNSRVNRSDADDHYHIDGEALPSYYELPAPPLYVKVPPEFSVPQEAHSSSRPSYQNNTTIIDIIPHPNISSNSTNQN